jgi:hypothetical protein
VFPTILFALESNLTTEGYPVVGGQFRIDLNAAPVRRIGQRDPNLIRHRFSRRRDAACASVIRPRVGFFVDHDLFRRHQKTFGSRAR